MQISIFRLELIELIGFGYDLSDNQDGLRCWRNEIYILWISSFLVIKIQVSDPGPTGPLVCLVYVVLIIFCWNLLVFFVNLSVKSLIFGPK